MKRQQTFNIKGMTRDISPSKSNGEYAYEIKNMRLTTQEGETMLSLVNEKGNKKYTISLQAINNEEVTIEGTIIGYCVLDKNLVLFTHNDTVDNIYRLWISGSDENTLVGYRLYQGDLDFEDDMVLETQGIYESENIQKIYWIDGKHQPRFINIAADDDTRRLWKRQETPFDFISEYEDNAEVSIEKSDYSGTFPAATVQYAMTYYNLNGQQTNIFYQSPLYYTAHSNRGAAADETVSNSFTIKLTKADPNFDYVRIYQIMRTTANAEAACRILIDVPITVNTSYDSDGNAVYKAADITITDTGNYGDSVDPYEIMYAGGREVIPQAMAQKDNTLFLGNFKVEQSLVPDNIVDELSKVADSNFSYIYGGAIQKGTTGSLYMYENQLKKSSQDITTFKGGENYRFGLIFQDERGEWSNVVYLCDKHNSTYPDDNITEFKPVKGQFTIPSGVVDLALEKGYKKAKGVVVYPSYGDRQVICQGVLCPTVYNINDRVHNQPYAQSSWFFRDLHLFSSLNPKHADHNVQNSHNWNISTMHTGTGETCLGDSEIYGASREDISAMNTAAEYNKMDMFVDWNLLTLNTPELDFADTVFPTGGMKMRIVGVIPLTSCSNDININTSTAPQDTTITNFKRQTFINPNESKEGNQLRLSEFDWWDKPYSKNTNPTATFWQYPVFPWHRSTSMITQTVASDTDNWISELNTKVLSNIRTSTVTLFFNNAESSNVYDISNVGIYNGVNALARLDKDDNDPDFTKNFNYYGEVDTLLSPSNNSGYHVLSLEGTTLNSLDETSQDMVRMKYKSSPHAAFQLRYTSAKKQTILPALQIGSTVIGKQSNPEGTPHWSENYDSGTPTTTVDPENTDETTASANIINAYIDKYSDGSTIDGTWVSNHKELVDIDNINSSGWPYRCWIAEDFLKAYLPTPVVGNIIIFPNVTTLCDINNLNTKGRKWQDQPMLYKVTGECVNQYTLNADDKAYQLYPIGSSSTSNPGEGYWKYVDNTNSVIHLYHVFGSYVNDNGQYEYLAWCPAVFVKDVSTKPVDDPSTDTDGNYLAQATIDLSSANSLASNYASYGFLYIGELYRNIDTNAIFGGKTASALQGNTWNIAGKAVNLTQGEDCKVPFDQGDTYYQRYDCLKTYPYTNEDPNQIVEILSFMCETRINIDGRYDTQRGQASNLTMRPTNFNLLNKVYTQNDNFISSSYLDYKRYKERNFPNTILWSKTKTYGEDVDSWTNIQQTSILDLDGDKGAVRALKNYNDNLLGFQDNGIARILYNERVQINASDGVPIEIANSGKVQGKQYISDHIGCTNKRTIQATTSGLYFMDGNSKDIYVMGEGISSLSKAKGFNSWLYNRDFSKFRTFFDEKSSSIYFVDDKACLVYNEQLGEFEGFYSYEGTDFMFNLGDHFTAIKNGGLWHQFAGDYNYFYGDDTINYQPFSVTVISNQGLNDKIFTNVEFLADSWEGDTIQSSTFDTLSTWNEYQLGISDLLTQNKNKQYWFSNLKRKFRVWRADIPRAMYVTPTISIDGMTQIVDKIEANDATIDNVDVGDYSLKKSLDRIRNTWAYVKLSMQKINKKKTVLHNLTVDYYD